MPFATTQPQTGFVDLSPLSNLVGDARIVSLGEATHGTSEFFAMKHRIVEYLVENMGFTVFAIEAALPEADAVNEYVLNGTGNPAQALAGMHFWTWNTQEVLDMIEWMRAYNLRRGDRPPVQFRGFDLQYSQYAMNHVNAYLDRIDHAAKTQINTLWQCWAPFSLNQTGYTTKSTTERNACAANLQQAYTLFESKRVEYMGKSSAREYQLMLRYARVVVQHEGATVRRPPGRDGYMAENVEWLANVAEPDAKLVLWAHNYHVSTELGTMGAALRQLFPGREMVIFGFAFDRGSFNAVSDGRLRSNHVDPFNGGVEETLRGAGHPRMFVDLRNILSEPARSYFGAPRSHWSIGAAFSEASPGAYRATLVLPKTFDVLIWIEETTASKLLQ